MIIEYIYNNQALYHEVAFFKKLNDFSIEQFFLSSSHDKLNNILTIRFSQELTQNEKDLIITTLQSLTAADIEWEKVRKIRNDLLVAGIDTLDKWRNQKERTGGETDINTTKKTEWADYLQELRDIPVTEPDPFNITWPNTPA